MRRLILAVLILTLVACGGSSPPAIPTKLTPPSSVVLPTVSGLTCGFVERRNSLVLNPTDAQAAEDCFWQAYQHCTVTGGETFAARESTDETPYPDATYGPVYLNVAVVHRFTVIVGSDGRCALRVTRDQHRESRTQSGTPVAAGGAYPGSLFTCMGITRSADGGLHVVGCQGSPTTAVYYDIPHP